MQRSTSDLPVDEIFPIMPMEFLPSTAHLTSNSWGRQGNNHFRAARRKQKSKTHFLWKMLFVYFYVLFSSDPCVPWQHLHLPDGFHGDLLGQGLKEWSHIHQDGLLVWIGSCNIWKKNYHVSFQFPHSIWEIAN